MTVLKTVDELKALKVAFEASPPADHSVRRLTVSSTERFRTSRHKVLIPGSKSFANRALVLGAMSAGPTLVEGLLLSDDSYWGLEALIRLGFTLELDTLARSVRLLPPAPGQSPRPGTAIHLGMAGTLARFFPAALLAGARPTPVPLRLTGEARLCERPLSPLIEALRQLGASIAGESLPLDVHPSVLGGRCSINGAVSGQFFSGLILAAAGAPSACVIERTDNLVQPDYVRMTIHAARHFGADLEDDPELHLVRSRPVPSLGARDGRYAVEADASTACYFLSMAALLGLELEVTNLGSASLQPDLGFIRFLEDLGCPFDVGETSIRFDPGRAQKRPFKGGGRHDFKAMSDQALTAGVLALFADAPTEIFGVGHIRSHESDRIARLVDNLRGLGAHAEERPDGFVVHPLVPAGEPQPHEWSSRLAGDWPTHRDHRFAMAGSLLALLSSRVIILDPACCEKTAPGFFAQLQEMGVEFTTNSR